MRPLASALRRPLPSFPLLRAFSASSSEPPRSGISLLYFKFNRALAIGANTFGPATAAVAGGCVVVYGVSSLALHVSTSILSLTLTDALYGGFGAGFLSCGLLVAGGTRFYRGVTLHPDAVFKVALAKVQGDARVAAQLGASVKAGPLQAYNSVPGHVSTQKLGWVDPRVQMLFQVVGEDTGREGMATVEAIKHKGAVKVTLLSLDILPRQGTPAGEPILIAGREDRLHVRGQLRGFLQTERAAYVPQDEPLRDEALFELQKEAEETEREAHESSSKTTN